MKIAASRACGIAASSYPISLPVNGIVNNRRDERGAAIALSAALRALPHAYLAAKKRAA